MSELAFNANGEVFDVPANVTAWRVRRMKPRGAPELVYGSDGRPLMVPIETTIDELRDAVGTAGKYRLDPVNDDGKCVEAVPPAYVQVVRQPRNAEPATIQTATGPSDDTLREAMRLNTELARSVIDKFPEMMTAAAELLRAADGAGLPARQPRAADADEDEDDDDEAAETNAPSGFEIINSLVAQIVPVIVTSLAGKKLPSVAEMLDWRKASPQAAKTTTEAAPAPKTAPAAAATTATATEVPPLDPATMAKVVAIQAALAPEESARARELAAELSPAELHAWFAELSALSVPDAVAKIRSLIGGAQ